MNKCLPILRAYGVGCVLAFMVSVPVVSAGQQTKAKRGDWPMWGGSPDRNMVSDETGIPATWDLATKKNI
ncbi:MAG: hypothetical protein GXP29_02375, partial [Planctomycetes bacterium]|nr:hypothetical protein [Planctomycetota bacterium]